MAEDVYIQGFGDKGIPDFATEATLRSLVGAMHTLGVKGLKPEHIEKLVDAISNGDSRSIAALLKLVKSSQDTEKTQKSVADVMNKQKEEIKKLREQNAKGDTQEKRDAKDMKESMEAFGGVMKEIQNGLKTGELGFGEAIKEGESALSKALGTLEMAPFGKLAKGIGAAATAVYGAAAGMNAFAIQAGEDRFNLANEIRQSGLATSLSTAQSGLVNFSEMVNRSSFTLGQAAEFANKFSAAVGDAGIERSLALVEDMAYGGAEGADMMRRFGLEFGGVANVAGQYLETVRNLGMLDRMNNQQLRGGMEEFMETVTVTSNVMKVNIQDAAEMIANTLNQRDDLTAMLATLPADMRTQVTSVVGAMGAQGTVVEEALAQFLASGSMADFMTTQTGQDLAGSQFGQQLLPLIESMGTQIQSGGDLGQIIANSETALQSILNSAQGSGNRQLLIQGADELGQRLVAQISRNIGRVGDANAGNRADTRAEGLEDDRAMVDRNMVQQEYELAMENVTNAIVKAADFGSNLDYLNQQNLKLIQSLETVAIQGIDKFGDEIADVTFTVEGALKGLGASITEFTTDILSFFSDEMEESAKLVEEQNRRSREMLGLEATETNGNAPPPVVVLTEEEKANRTAEEQAILLAEKERAFEVEKRRWESGRNQGVVPEEFRDVQEFDENRAIAALERLQPDTPIVDNQIQIAPEFAPTLHMELPQDFVNDWNEKIRIESAREDVLNNALMVNEAIRSDIAGLGDTIDTSSSEPIVINNEPVDINGMIIDGSTIEIPGLDQPIERQENLGETGKSFDDMLVAYLKATGNMEDFIGSVEGQLLAGDAVASEMLPLLQQIGDGILDQSVIYGQGSVSQAAMLQGSEEDKQLYRDFNEYKTEMRNQLLEQYSAENERLTGSSRLDRVDRSKADMRAMRMAMGRFASEINEGGFGEVTIDGVGLSDAVKAQLHSAISPEQFQQQTISEQDVQRAELVEPETIRAMFGALTGSTRDIENLVEQLGVGNKSVDFDLENERTQAQVVEFTKIVDELRAANALSDERLAEVLSEIRKADTDYTFGWNASENTERETNEKRQLISTMTRLIDELQK